MRLCEPWGFTITLSFADPVVLLLLPLPLLAYRRLRRGPRAAIEYSDLNLFDGLPSGRARWSRFFLPLFKSLALLCLIIAAAGPRQPDLKTRIQTESVAIVFVLDISGSMDAETFEWQSSSAPISRKEAGKRAIHLFVEGGEAPDGTKFAGRSTERGTDAVGLVTFSLWPNPVCPPTVNHSILLKLLDDQRPITIRDEGSNIGDALVQGIGLLEKAKPKRKVLVLLSDGELTYPDRQDESQKPMYPRAAAQIAGNLKIPIYIIDTGGPLPPDANAADVANRTEARFIEDAVATMTGGKVFEANSGPQLLKTCEEIDKLERTRIETPAYRRHRSFYPWFAGAAAGLIALVFLLEATVWRRIP